MLNSASAHSTDLTSALSSTWASSPPDAPLSQDTNSVLIAVVASSTGGLVLMAIGVWVLIRMRRRRQIPEKIVLVGPSLKTSEQLQSYISTALMTMDTLLVTDLSRPEFTALQNLFTKPTDERTTV